jgi:deferrochelatase/peroxidase EfeB
MTEADFADTQGLVRFGYGHMTKASYALLRVKNTAAAKAWFRSAPVTTAVAQKPPPKTAMNIAFTASGLRALGVPESIMTGFSHEFRGGMAQESRARQLGDIGNNAPSTWSWGSYGHEPHAMVMFFAEPDQFDSFLEGAKGDAWRDAFEPDVIWLGTSNLDGDEPFGFADGISQPQIDWEQQLQRPCVQLAYTNIVALGEFLLGYRNEYGKITDRPLLEPDPATAGLFDAKDAPGKKDLGRNGTYLVMRQLEQDVRGFWQFVYKQTGGNLAEAAQLGAKMVGRTRAGDPLVPIEDQPIPGIDPTAKQNHFTYESDPLGVGCPFGAHIRRSNPRNSDFPEQRLGLLRKLIIMLGFGPKGFYDDLTSSVRFHRILRRGREFGSELSPEEARQPTPPNESPRGLHFVCLNANISRQFEFLQNAWVASTKFSGVTGESDPLLGNRESIPGCPVTGNFTMPGKGTLRQRVSNLPQFVTLRGGAYFFLPSLRALRYFAGD